MAADVETRAVEGLNLDTHADHNPWSRNPDVLEPPSPGGSDSGSDYSQPLTPREQTHSLRQSGQMTPKRPRSDTAFMDAQSPKTVVFPDRTSSASTDTFHDTRTDVDDLPDPGAAPAATTHPTSAKDRLSIVTPSSAAAAKSSSTRSPVSDYAGSGSPPLMSSKNVSPMTPREARGSVDSFASIALSESSLDYDHLSTQQVNDALATPRIGTSRTSQHVRKPSSLEIVQNQWGPPTRQDTLFDVSRDEPPNSPLSAPLLGDRRRSSYMHSPSSALAEPSDEAFDAAAGAERNSTPRPSSSGSETTELDWSALDKTEEQEKEDKDLPEGVEDESTKFLLARLEQENAKFTAGPKAEASVNTPTSRKRSDTRPPSMAHLKKLVSGKEPPTIRYSLAADVPLPEEPPPMTELEFWTALVQDYPSTAARLPTLTTTKIRSGIPPPLRGVVWTSMSGARDKSLDDSFENLQNEKSSYEGIINKDVGRSFPGVELFRDADGEGQKMLGKVLKCFSLHDKDIGYCQGLGFLVGPLLMNMGDKEAFCVLVRLMDHYALRPSFLPSLSGLHMRIFQFSNLLAQHHPGLSAHLLDLGIEPAYLSQWFLSCFAVTCPLPMLFRIYDVIFAEGANETVMRVALALFRRNEEQIMQSVEFEEVMQLLLGRSLWDCYAGNADELVDDFTSLGNIITHERLAELEKEFENQSREVVGQSAGFLPDVQNAASRFLGRLWAPNHGSTTSKNNNSLSPSSADKDNTPSAGILGRGSFLRRSPSKQSISTLNENVSEGSSGSGSNSLASTAPTEGDVHDIGRESRADTISLRSKPDSLRTVSVTANQGLGVSREQYDLHGQIEDLLTALSEAQREHAQLSAMLQKEREERNDDHKIVKRLINSLQKDDNKSKGKDRRSMPPPSRTPSELKGEVQDSVAKKRRTLPPRERPQLRELPPHIANKPGAEENLTELLHQVEGRLETNARFSASLETKSQLRSTLTRTREQLATAEETLKELTDRAEFSETSLMTFQGESESLRAEVEELRVRVNEEFRTRQKLELQVQNMEIQAKMDAKNLSQKERLERTEALVTPLSPTKVDAIAVASKVDAPAGAAEPGSRQTSLSSAPSTTNGLRELNFGGPRESLSSVASSKDTDQHTDSLNSPEINIYPSIAENVVQESAPVVAEPPSASAPEPAQSSAPTTPTTPTPYSVPQLAPPNPTSSLAVPGQRTGFARRTTSLAAKEVFTTPKQEPVPDDALLLELVNAKTSEAQARQEIDELKRTMNLQKRRGEEALVQLQAEMEAIRAETQKAQEDAKKARQEAERARQEVFDASPMATPGSSLPVTPAPENVVVSSPVTATPVETIPVPKKTDTPPLSASSTVGGWFWGRRTASTTKAAAPSPDNA